MSICAAVSTCLAVFVASVGNAQDIAGVWVGVAEARPDSGLPVSVRLKIDQKGDSVRVALSLPESRLIDLAIPSPYSDSAYATYSQGHLHVEFTPDIGLSFIAAWVLVNWSVSCSTESWSAKASVERYR